MNVVRIAFAVAAMSVIATPALAQQGGYCAPRESIIEQLGESYGETRQAGGLQGGRAIVEIYASEETGTWTILVTRPDGTSCAVAAGQSWSAEVSEITAPGGSDI